MDLSRLCYKLCHDKDDAQDLYQETWMKAIRFIRKYDSTKPFNKWLFTICVNTFKTKARKNKRVYNFQTNDDKDTFLSLIEDPRDHLEDFAALRCSILKLPVKYRIAITLKYFKDYTDNEVAEIIGIPVGTVKSRLNMAKKLLKEDLS